jgi:hypothetical protein
MSKKIDKKLKDLEKENDKLEKIIENTRDKFLNDTKKLTDQNAKLLNQLKNLQVKRIKVDNEFNLVAKALGKWEDMMHNMNVDKLDEKINKLEQQKNNLRKQALKYEKEISFLSQTG